MPELTREEKLKLVEKLPERLQDFLYSEDTGAFFLYLGEKYSLDDEKVSRLSKIVADIILKIIPITSLAQEIANKVMSDPQTAMTIAQELNSELLMPILTPTSPTTQAPSAVSPKPAATPAAPISQPVPTPVVSAAKPATPAAPRADQYREPTTGGPEVVDLRKTPPPPMQMPVAAAPIPPRPPMPTLPIATKPLTFTKPIEPAKPVPLIEAEPHQKEEVKIPEPPKPPVASPSTPLGTGKAEPQFIVRPPGLSPTDFHSNVLDLRKDKGEF